MITRYSLLKYFAGATKQQIDAVVKKLGVPAEELLSLANAADPTNENRFEAWVIKQMGLKKIQLPGQQKEIQNLLQTFVDLSNKRQLVEKDINKYSYEKLQQEIKNILEQDISESETLQEYLSLDGVSIFAQNRDWLILRSETAESSAELASGTRWCTSDPEVAEDYASLLIIFKKTGRHLEKMYQLAEDGTDLKNIQDQKPGTIEDSLGSLIFEEYKNSSFSDSYLVETVKTLFASGWEPSEEKTKEVVEYILPDIHSSDIYETIEITYIHTFRNAYLDYRNRGMDEDYVIELIDEYFTGFHDVPRWLEFEKEILKGNFLSPKDERVLSLIYRYLAWVPTSETKERIPIDIFCFNIEPVDLTLWARNMYYYFYKVLKTGDRIPEFESLIEKIIKKEDIPFDYITSLIGEYWICVARKGEEWLEVEDFLLDHHLRGAFSADGVYASGWERYAQGLRG